MDAHQTPLFAAILITCAVLALVFAFFAFSIIRQQRRYVELNRKTILSEITAMENERIRIAKDLHDDMGPFLSYIKFQVSSVESASEEEMALLTDASSRIDEAIQKLRAIAANMMPGTLVRKGLIVAINEMSYHINQYTHTQLAFHYDADVVLPTDMNINLYRIISEVVQNALKHAEAKNILIDLRADDKKLTVTCEDNGKGFDYNRLLQEEKGLGLRNIRSRVELMNGKLFVQSVPGKGTQYIFELPKRS